jgi:hypothetical protein
MSTQIAVRLPEDIVDGASCGPAVRLSARHRVEAASSCAKANLT